MKIGHSANNESWPTPLEAMDLLDAVNAGKETVVLGTTEFSITYEEEGTVYVKPVHGFVPCGRFPKWKLQSLGL